MDNSSMASNSGIVTNQLPFAYIQLRAKVFQAFLLGASALGLGLVVLSIGRMNPIFLVAIIALFILQLVVTFIPMPYSLRAWSALAILFLLGIQDLLRLGIYGSARVYFLLLVLLASFLFEKRRYLLFIVASLLAIAAIGWLLLSGNIEINTTGIQSGTLLIWLGESALFSIASLALSEALRKLRDEYLVTQATLKNAMSTLNNERVNLEVRVHERTRELIQSAETEKKRSERLMAISEIIRSVTSIKEPNELLKALTHQIGEKFHLYHVGIFINDEEANYTVLQATNSTGGERLMAKGYKVKIDQSGVINFTAASGIPRTAKRAKDDILFDSNPDLPETRSIMALPLTVNSKKLGVLDLESNVEGGLSEQDLDTLRSLADQVAIAIDNTRAYSETSHALAEAQVVYGHYMRQAWDEIAIERRKAGYRFAGTQLNEINTPLDFPEIITAISTGKLVTNLDENPSVTIPLKLREEVIGALDIRSNTPNRQWNENEMALIQAVAERVALALENARLFEETTRRADRERAVSEITTHIRSNTDPQAMLQTALEELKRALGAKDIRIRPYASPPAGPTEN